MLTAETIIMPDPNPIASARPKGTHSVSVVIPTRNRSSLVINAVRSALDQSFSPFELIVVIDGPESMADGSTVEALGEVRDARLRVIPLATSVGGSEARNHGVRAARGNWIAFLDDDDVWLPRKLAVQLAFADALPRKQLPILSCRVRARAPQWEEVWPRKVYCPGQPLDEYLFCRRGWGYGEALLQTSTLLVPRRLMERVPFAAGLPRHQDWDWLLRAAAEPEAAVYCVGDAALVVFHVEGNRNSVSRSADWQSSLEWARCRRAFISRRALRGFLVTECAAQAQRESWTQRAAVVHALMRTGPPTPRELMQALTFLLIPRRTRRLCRELARRLHGAAISRV
jgi:glycosyltransferase involved in cell wall biosynthesis